MQVNKLEDLREVHNLKSKDLASYLNVNKSTYSEWEHNKIPIPTKRLIELADFYQINIDYMLGLTNNKTETKGTNIDLLLIGNNIKEIRKSLNLTLRDLGKTLKCSFSSVAGYERGEYLIQSEILITLCKISGYSIDWVLGRSNKKKIIK